MKNHKSRTFALGALAMFVAMAAGCAYSTGGSLGPYVNWQLNARTDAGLNDGGGLDVDANVNAKVTLGPRGSGSTAPTQPADSNE